MLFCLGCVVMKTKAKLFVIIPSIHRELLYNTHTKEVLCEGVVYAHIENKIYTKVYPRKPGRQVYWDVALISYFHPTLLVIVSPNYKAEISCDILRKIGLRNCSRKQYNGMLYNPISVMKETDNRPYHN